MKKKLSLALLCCMSLGLVACGSEDTNKDTTTTEATTAAQTTQAATEATTAAQTTQAATEAATEAPASAEATVTAYYEDGATETLTDQGDGTFKTPKGAVYYLGDDGVYRARGYTDLYTTNPAQ